MGAAEPPRFCTCQGFPLAQPKWMRFWYARVQIRIIRIWWRNENRSQLELARKLLIARIMPGAVAQESCQPYRCFFATSGKTPIDTPTKIMV